MLLVANLVNYRNEDGCSQRVHSKS